MALGLQKRKTVQKASAAGVGAMLCQQGCSRCLDLRTRTAIYWLCDGWPLVSVGGNWDNTSQGCCKK